MRYVYVWRAILQQLLQIDAGGLSKHSKSTTLDVHLVSSSILSWQQEQRCASCASPTIFIAQSALDRSIKLRVVCLYCPIRDASGRAGLATSRSGHYRHLVTLVCRRQACADNSADADVVLPGLAGP
jgi:hypothetical protein